MLPVGFRCLVKTNTCGVHNYLCSLKFVLQAEPLFSVTTIALRYNLHYKSYNGLLLKFLFSKCWWNCTLKISPSTLALTYKLIKDNLGTRLHHLAVSGRNQRVSYGWGSVQSLRHKRVWWVNLGRSHHIKDEEDLCLMVITQYFIGCIKWKYWLQGLEFIYIYIY